MPVMFPDEHRVRPREVEQHHVGFAVDHAHGRRVRGRRIVRVQHIILKAIDQVDDLIASADIHVVSERAVRTEFHPDPGGEIE